MPRNAVAACAALALVLAAAAPASAHIRLDVPQNRYEDQKNGPCGATDDRRTERVTVYAPGETITVRWEETIKHPSHFRIAFSQHGSGEFEDPADFHDYYTNDAVLLDEIPDRDEGGFYEVEVTLPNVECDDCTLQLMQIMYDRAAYGPDALYWQCADLELREGAGGGPGPENGSSGGCRIGAEGGAGAALSLLVAVAVLYAPSARRARAG